MAGMDKRSSVYTDSMRPIQPVYPARGEPFAVYIITDGEPPDGAEHVIDFPKCAFQVAMRKGPSSLYRVPDDTPVNGNWELFGE